MGAGRIPGRINAQRLSRSDPARIHATVRRRLAHRACTRRLPFACLGAAAVVTTVAGLPSGLEKRPEAVDATPCFRHSRRAA